MRQKIKVPIFRPKLPMAQEILPYLHRIDKSQQYTNSGELVRELEAQIASYLGLPATCVVLVSNATLAIEGAIRTSQNHNRKWILPSWTFAATAHALSNSNVEFCFGDISNDWRLNLSELPRHEYALLDVVPFGDDIDLNRYTNLKSNVVVDAAVSLPLARNIGGQLSNNVSLVFSMHATKPISTGEGGVFCSADPEWASRVRAWAKFGFSTKRIASTSGTNAKMNEYSAAVGIASFKAWSNNEKRLIQLCLWAKNLSQILGVNTQPSLMHNKFSPYWIIWSESIERIELICATLEEDGIETRRWWEFGCHRMPAFSNAPSIGFLDNTDYFSARSIGLPLFVDLTDDEKFVIENSLTRA